MNEITAVLERLYSITGITFSLVDDTGKVLFSKPSTAGDIVQAEAGMSVIGDFEKRGRDSTHPQICFFEPGFLLGIIKVRDHAYVLVGLVSPYQHTRDEVLRTVNEAINSAHLHVFCDMILQQPLVSLEKMKDLICVLSALFHNEIPPENILFVDQVQNLKTDVSLLDRQMFEQRETVEYHVPQDFEKAICAAVEAGDRAMLERALFAPVPGKVGRMSSNELRQQKYSFICMATLVSRAAIRGGLDQETSYSLSDLYCQRADMLTEIPLIQNLTFTMLMDYCGKVRENNKRPASTPVIENCLRYISVHLHEPISLEMLSDHVGLCTRSLSLRFKAEMGMGIPEYIHREKLREAKYLLHHTDYSLSAITTVLNYPSQSYFTQIFKKYDGRTPQQYRDEKQK